MSSTRVLQAGAPMRSLESVLEIEDVRDRVIGVGWWLAANGHGDLGNDKILSMLGITELEWETALETMAEEEEKWRDAGEPPEANLTSKPIDIDALAKGNYAERERLLAEWSQENWLGIEALNLKSLGGEAEAERLHAKGQECLKRLRAIGVPAKVVGAGGLIKFGQRHERPEWLAHVWAMAKEAEGSKKRLAQFLGLDSRTMRTWLKRGRENEKARLDAVSVRELPYVLFRRAVVLGGAEYEHEVAKIARGVDVVGLKGADKVKAAQHALDRIDRANDPLRRAQVEKARYQAQAARLDAEVAALKIDILKVARAKVAEGDLAGAIRLISMDANAMGKSVYEDESKMQRIIDVQVKALVAAKLKKAGLPANGASEAEAPDAPF